MILKPTPPHSEWGFLLTNFSVAGYNRYKQQTLPLNDFAFLGHFQSKLDLLKNKIIKENWDYPNFGIIEEAGNGSDMENPILYNYIHHTFIRILQERKIYFRHGEFACFNTGLFTKSLQDIYMYFAPNYVEKRNKEWYLVGFFTGVALFKKTGHSNWPPRANYFKTPTKLTYDVRLPLEVLRKSMGHIIEENFDRLPKEIQQLNKVGIKSKFEQAIKNAEILVKRDYRIALPQFYRMQFQLLLPICLRNPTKADLALSVFKHINVYEGTTCLPLDWAAQNTRLIAPIDGTWLNRSIY